MNTPVLGVDLEAVGVVLHAHERLDLRAVLRRRVPISCVEAIATRAACRRRRCQLQALAVQAKAVARGESDRVHTTVLHDRGRAPLDARGGGQGPPHPEVANVDAAAVAQGHRRHHAVDPRRHRDGGLIGCLACGHVLLAFDRSGLGGADLGQRHQSQRPRDRDGGNGAAGRIALVVDRLELNGVRAYADGLGRGDARDGHAVDHGAVNQDLDARDTAVAVRGGARHGHRDLSLRISKEARAVGGRTQGDGGRGIDIDAVSRRRRHAAVRVGRAQLNQVRPRSSGRVGRVDRRRRRTCQRLDRGRIDQNLRLRDHVTRVRIGGRTADRNRHAGSGPIDHRRRWGIERHRGRSVDVNTHEATGRGHPLVVSCLQLEGVCASSHWIRRRDVASGDGRDADTVDQQLDVGHGAVAIRRTASDRHRVRRACGDLVDGAIGWRTHRC